MTAKLSSSSESTVRYIIDSAYRDDKSSSTTDFKITFEKKISNVYGFQIVSVQIPYTFYAINNTNNNLVFKVVGQPDAYNATVSPGNYNIYTFTSALISAMNSADVGATYTGSYDTKTQKITISRPSGTFALTAEGNMSGILGITEDTGADTSHETGIVIITGSNYLTISSNALSQYIPHSTGSLIHTVPVNVNATGIIIDTPTSGSSTTILNTAIDITTLDFQVYDSSRTLLDLNNCNWSMQILFYF